jgi:hypothetical protein
MQHNFDNEIHCATEAHRRGNKPACRHHLLQAIESLDAPQHQYLRDLPLQTKVQGIDAQVWQVIKHEPEYLRVKLRLLTTGNHQEWDAPEDMRVEWRKTGCCEIWTIVDGCGELSLSCARTDHAACGECETDAACDCSCHPRTFAFADALAIMERGGECEHFWGPSQEWLSSRIRNGDREYQFKGPTKGWTIDPWAGNWESLDWRPCSAPTQYTWEQAEAGMRERKEEWYGQLPTWSRPYVFRLNNEDKRYWFFEVKNPNGWTSFHRIDLLKQCTWRPYNPEAQR